MIPAEVLTDPELSGRDVKVYGFITLSRRGSFASVGGRRISEFVHANRDDVRDSVETLVKRGHVAVENGGKGKRLRFKLLSAWFTKAEAPAPVAGSSISPALGGRKIDPFAPSRVVFCPRCSKRCRALLKVGYCRGCRWNDKVDGRIEAKLKTA